MFAQAAPTLKNWKQIIPIAHNFHVNNAGPVCSNREEGPDLIGLISDQSVLATTRNGWRILLQKRKSLSHN